MTGPRVPAWLAAVVPPAGGLTMLAVTGGVDTGIAVTVGLGIVVWCPWLIWRWLRERAALGRAGWSSAARWEERARGAEHEARMRERARLAADMHDLVGHDLARAALRLGGLELDRTLSRDARAAVGQAREQVTSAAEHLTRAVSALDADREPVSAPGEIEVLAEGVRAAGAEVVVVPAGTAPLLDALGPAVSTLVVRVVREGLTNAIKHAPGAPIEVSLARTPDALGVVVRTRGAAGGPASPGAGRGLRSLDAGVGALGGTLGHGISDGDHLLVARVPLVPEPVDGDPPAVEVDRRAAVGAVRRSRRLAVLGIGAGIAVALLLAAGYRVVDAATSVLPATTFDRLAAGTPRAAVADVLPTRTRTDATGPPVPPGSWCEHYSASADPFSLDLHRLCWADGRLVHKDLVRRDTFDPGTIGT